MVWWRLSNPEALIRSKKREGGEEAVEGSETGACLGLLGLASDQGQGERSRGSANLATCMQAKSEGKKQPCCSTRMRGKQSMHLHSLAKRGSSFGAFNRQPSSQQPAASHASRCSRWSTLKQLIRINQGPPLILVTLYAVECLLYDTPPREASQVGSTALRRTGIFASTGRSWARLGTAHTRCARTNRKQPNW